MMTIGMLSMKCFSYTTFTFCCFASDRMGREKKALEACNESNYAVCMDIMQFNL